MFEGQELPLLGCLHLQQVANQAVFEDSAEAEELHAEQVAFLGRGPIEIVDFPMKNGDLP